MASKPKTKTEVAQQESPAEEASKEDVNDYTGKKAEKAEEPSESPASQFTQGEAEIDSQEEKGSRKKLWIILVVILLGLGILGGAFIFFQSGFTFELSFGKSDSKPTPQPTAPPKPTKEKIDLKAYKIKILNGSGIAGEAALVQGDLKEEGFDVVSVGNADKSDYEETVISAKKEINDEFLSELKDSLKKRGPVGGIKILEDTEDTDVVVIIGQKADPEITSEPE